MFSAQPLEERPHHLGAAKSLEPGTDVFVVPLQRANLEDAVGGNRSGLSECEEEQGVELSTHSEERTSDCKHQSKAHIWSWSRFAAFNIQ